MMFLRRRKWNRGVQSCDADDGAVEIIEGFFIDDGCDFSGEASGTRVLVKDDDFVRLLHGLRDGFAIDRVECAQVEDFDVDAVFFQDLSAP